MYYTKHRLLTNQSARRVLSILQIIIKQDTILKCILNVNARLLKKNGKCQTAIRLIDKTEGTALFMFSFLFTSEISSFQ